MDTSGRLNTDALPVLNNPVLINLEEQQLTQVWPGLAGTTRVEKTAPVPELPVLHQGWTGGQQELVDAETKHLRIFCSWGHEGWVQPGCGPPPSI